MKALFPYRVVWPLAEGDSIFWASSGLDAASYAVALHQLGQRHNEKGFRMFVRPWANDAVAESFTLEEVIEGEKEPEVGP